MSEVLPQADIVFTGFSWTMGPTSVSSLLLKLLNFVEWVATAVRDPDMSVVAPVLEPTVLPSSLGVKRLWSGD